MVSRVMLGAYSLFILMAWPIGLYVDSATLLNQPAQTTEIEQIEDIRYYSGPDSHDKKHLLDIYNPNNQSDLPVIFFVHGGSWEDGDKSLYGYLGDNLASLGFTTVIPNYRLSPSVRHPAHIEDVAKAFAWVHENISDYGGDPAQIYLVGHSAGGHLTSLLALDERYLGTHQLTPDVIAGVVGVSGVYDLTVYPSFFFFDTFDADEESRAEASPINHIDESQPPFLVLFAEFDYPTLASQAIRFAERLVESSTPVELYEIPNQSHISIVIALGQRNEAITDLVLDFFNSNE